MDLIRTVLELLRQQLNQFFANTDPRQEDWVMLANIVDQDGRPFSSAKDKIVMTLANITHETIVSTYAPTVKSKGGSYAVVTPPLYIDLYVLFYANFYDDNYRQGLTMISRTISFFQQNPMFDANTLPDLPKAIDKLTLEITNLDLLEVNYLMGMLGAKYLPSVFYKVRMLPFVSGAMEAVTPPVSGEDTSGRAPT